MADPIYVLGAGGHAKVVCDILLELGTRPSACLVDELDGPAEEPGPLGIPVRSAGPEDAYPPAARFVVAIGDNHLRRRVAERYSRFGSAVHPSATIGRDVTIEPGAVVMAGVVVNVGARIGRHCILNTGSRVDHDCVLEDYSSVAPGATLGGNVRVGRGAAVSLGASVIHGVTIGEHTVVGAGATVVEDLPGSVVAYGTPARVVREREIGEPYL